MKPLFVFSLPRSGSTLVQRILMSSGQISSASEPWLLLPFIYTLKASGAITEYGHRLGVAAIEDFYKGLPHGKEDYVESLRKFTMELYRKRANQECAYFLDKTPRYHLICDEIIKFFPEGKFIFLMRNPLAVAASIINSLYRGKWKLATCYIDLYDGMLNLLNAFSTNEAVAHKVLYEKMVQDPQGEIKKICDYLEINFKSQMVTDFKAIHLPGRMGDKTGTQKYDSIHSSASDGWTKTYNNPLRRHWANRYLEWIGAANLKSMGFNYFELKSALCRDKSINVYSLCYDLLITLVLKIRIARSPLRVHHKAPINYLFA